MHDVSAVMVPLRVTAPGATRPRSSLHASTAANVTVWSVPARPAAVQATVTRSRSGATSGTVRVRFPAGPSVSVVTVPADGVHDAAAGTTVNPSLTSMLPLAVRDVSSRPAISTASRHDTDSWTVLEPAPGSVAVAVAVPAAVQPSVAVAVRWNVVVASNPKLGDTTPGSWPSSVTSAPTAHATPSSAAFADASAATTKGRPDAITQANAASTPDGVTAAGSQRPPPTVRTANEPISPA